MKTHQHTRRHTPLPLKPLPILMLCHSFHIVYHHGDCLLATAGGKPVCEQFPLSVSQTEEQQREQPSSSLLWAGQMMSGRVQYFFFFLIAITCQLWLVCRMDFSRCSSSFEAFLHHLSSSLHPYSFIFFPSFQQCNVILTWYTYVLHIETRAAAA